MEEELDLLDLLLAFWKKKIWIILFAILGVVFGFVYTKFIITPQYKSSVTLILSKPEASTGYNSNDAITQSDITLNQKLISTYSEILKSKRVGKAVIDRLKLTMSYNELKNGISVNSVKDTDVIKVSVVSKKPELSKEIITEMIDIFKSEVDRIYGIKNVSIIDEAEVEKAPINVNYVKNMLLFGFIAIALVCAVIFMIYYFDNTIKSSEMITKITDLPVLATIPKVDDKIGGKKND